MVNTGGGGLGEPGWKPGPPGAVPSSAGRGGARAAAKQPPPADKGTGGGRGAGE
jgi:hypothetical protein